MLACYLIQLLPNLVPDQHVQAGLHNCYFLFRQRNDRHCFRWFPLLPVRAQTKPVDLLFLGFDRLAHDNILRAGAPRFVYLPTLYSGSQVGYFVFLQHSVRFARVDLSGTFRGYSPRHGQLCDEDNNWTVTHFGPRVTLYHRKKI